jgi:hypothetical protein
MVGEVVTGSDEVLMRFLSLQLPARIQRLVKKYQRDARKVSVMGDVSSTKVLNLFAISLEFSVRIL